MFQKDIQGILQEASKPPQEWDDHEHTIFAHTAALSSYLWLRGIDSKFEMDMTSGECRLLVDLGNEGCVVLIVENPFNTRIMIGRDGKETQYSHGLSRNVVIQGYAMRRVDYALYLRLPKRLQDAVRENNMEEPGQKKLEEAIRRIEEVKEKHGFYGKLTRNIAEMRRIEKIKKRHGFYGKLAPDIAAIRRREEWNKVNQYNRLIQKISKYATISALAVSVIAIGVLLVR